MKKIIILNLEHDLYEALLIEKANTGQSITKIINSAIQQGVDYYDAKCAENDKKDDMCVHNRFTIF